MNKINQIIASVGLLAIASSAHATLINFQTIADGTAAQGAVGESAWTSFNTASYGRDITITSTPDDGNPAMDQNLMSILMLVLLVWACVALV